MSTLIQALETALAAAKSEGAMFAESAVRVAELENENGDLIDTIAELRSQLGTAPTEPPAALPVSIALAHAARKEGLSIQQARAIFASVTPEEAAAISKLARDEQARAEAEHASREKKNSKAKARRQ